MSLDQLSLAVLAALAEQQQAISSLRLAKQLGVQQSSLWRCLAVLAGGVVNPGQAASGLGWVVVQHQDERKMLSLSPLGRAIWSELSEAQ